MPSISLGKKIGGITCMIFSTMIHLWRTTKASRATFALRFTKDLNEALVEIKTKVRQALVLS